MKTRHDWTIDEVRAVHDMPLLDLVHRAQQVHREHFGDNAVQLAACNERFHAILCDPPTGCGPRQRDRPDVQEWDKLWSDEIVGIFSVIISFWFGQRLVSKWSK